jgi:hypothetical protein
MQKAREVLESHYAHLHMVPGDDDDRYCGLASVLMTLRCFGMHLLVSLCSHRPC